MPLYDIRRGVANNLIRYITSDILRQSMGYADHGAIFRKFYQTPLQKVDFHRLFCRGKEDENLNSTLLVEKNEGRDPLPLYHSPFKMKSTAWSQISLPGLLETQPRISLKRKPGDGTSSSAICRKRRLLWRATGIRHRA